MSDHTEIYKQHREVQNKTTYVLMAVAASAIALSLKRTADSKIAYSMIPLALAVLSWGLSFFCGYRYLRWVDVSLSANYALLEVVEGRHPVTGVHPQKIEAASQGIREAMEHNSKKAASSAKWQFRLLILGALLFISWHVIEMVNATANSGG